MLDLLSTRSKHFPPVREVFLPVDPSFLPIRPIFPTKAPSKQSMRGAETPNSATDETSPVTKDNSQVLSDNILNKNYTKLSLSKGEIHMKRKTLSTSFKSEGMLF